MYFVKLFLGIFLISIAKAEALEDQEGVFSKCKENGYIAITFDDGPSSLTGSVLDVLKEKGIKTTFFLNGGNHFPIGDSIETLKRLCNEGHEIGSHTWNHIDLINSTPDEIRKEMMELEVKVHEMIGLKMTIMRPPYGNINDNVVSILHGELKYSIVLWNLDTNDWRNLEDIESSMDEYRDAMENTTSAESSFISLHHDHVVQSATLTRQAIEYALSKGYTPVTVSECLGLVQSKCNINNSGNNLFSVFPLYQITILVTITQLWNY